MKTIEPKILYFGTPVALISSLNEDGSTNLSPISSFWVLGYTITPGVLNDAKLADNLARHGECVVNLPDPQMWETVERLAPLTGRDPVPTEKADRFHTEADKFSAAGLTPLLSETVEPRRVAECPVHLEARVLDRHQLGGRTLSAMGGGVVAIAEIWRVHADEKYLVPESDHIDSGRWSPLIYNFRHYYGLGDEELGSTFRAET